MMKERKHAAEYIAREVGKMLVSMERIESLTIEEKQKNDYVTEADTAAERMIIDYLSSRFPNDGFLGEECGREDSTMPRWIIDPIDGTMNFIRKIPNFTVSIGWEEEAGNPVVGVVYNVRQDEMFSASAGDGAFCNGERISVSRVSDPAKALMICETPHRKKQWAPRYWQLFTRLFSQVSDIRTFGSIALELCYLASGRMDAVFQYHLGYWDIAAASAILREAGGAIEPIDPLANLSTMPCDIIASNGLLHQWISDEVRGFGTIRS